MLQSLIRAVRDYTAHADPLARTANKVALVVGSNLPFYPIYMHWIVGESAWPAWLSLMTMPGFLMVPWLSRRHGLAGRALLPIVGVANTILCTKALGVRTGVELFLLPCILLAAILFSLRVMRSSRSRVARSLRKSFRRLKFGSSVQIVSW